MKRTMNFTTMYLLLFLGWFLMALPIAVTVLIFGINNLKEKKASPFIVSYSTIGIIISLIYIILFIANS